MTEEKSEEMYMLLGNIRCSLYGLKTTRRIAKAALNTVCEECLTSEVVDSHAWNRLLRELDDMQEIVSEIQLYRDALLELVKGEDE